MRLIVDAMGGDHAPAEIVKGSVDAAAAYGVALTLVGDAQKISEELSKLGASKDSFEIIPASEVITMEDAPVAAIKQKSDSSMARGLSLLRQEPDSVFISAGNTGALMAGGLLKVGRIRGIDRPALAPLMPNKGPGTLLIDAGANTECKPENLVQFARMGAIYMEKMLGRSHPKVGLVNIGAHEGAVFSKAETGGSGRQDAFGLQQFGYRCRKRQNARLGMLGTHQISFGPFKAKLGQGLAEQGVRPVKDVSNHRMRIV